MDKRVNIQFSTTDTALDSLLHINIDGIYRNVEFRYYGKICLVLLVYFNTESNYKTQLVRLGYELRRLIGRWEFVGPLCTNPSLHNPATHYMTKVTLRGEIRWRCTDISCNKDIKSGSNNSSIMSFADFTNAIMTLPDPDRNLTEFVPVSTDKSHTAYLLEKVTLLTELNTGLTESLNEAAHREIKLIKELAEWGKAKLLPEDLPKAADLMLRFLAGVNFQDHPREEQREFLVLFSRLRLALKDEGVVTSGD